MQQHEYKINTRLGIKPWNVSITLIISRKRQLSLFLRLCLFEAIINIYCEASCLKNHNIMWCILWNIECGFLNVLGWATLIASITFLMNNTLHTMILNCFIKWWSMNRVIFCLVDALRKCKTGKRFHHCDTPNCEFFCHFLFDTSIKGKKISRKNNNIRLISQIMLLAYRDNGNIDSIGSTSFGSFSSKNYECVGNETSIYDCPNNEKQCTAPSAIFRPWTELRCKRKTYWIHNNKYNCTFFFTRL